MYINSVILRSIPGPAIKALNILREMKSLRSVPRLECDAERLRSAREVTIRELFTSGEIEMWWEEIKKQADEFDIPDMTGGVNPGDRKAIFHLVSRFKPSSVLEIGTHIGSSTVSIASALFMNQTRNNGKQSKLITVDKNDVNDTVTQPWLRSGVKYSPIEIIQKLKLEPIVEFVNDISLHYLEKCEQKFDFIFFDGGMAAKTVYREIPAALKLLENDGVILLHNYFPWLKPLWSNKVVLPGPYLAVERLKKEGAKIDVLPLGKLPWPTKLQSNVTSLALLVRNGQ
jgi:predicted O-methyltransferase YrrM